MVADNDADEIRKEILSTFVQVRESNKSSIV